MATKHCDFDYEAMKQGFTDWIRWTLCFSNLTYYFKLSFGCNNLWCPGVSTFLACRDMGNPTPPTTSKKKSKLFQCINIFDKLKNKNYVGRFFFLTL